MIIGVCGFCSTGSSAVSDYLKEFRENQVLDMLEFTLAYIPDGLSDLEYHLMLNNVRDDSCSIAIPRFRNLMRAFERSGITKNRNFTKKQIRDATEKFIKTLTQIKWKAMRRTDFLLYNNSTFYRYVGLSLMKQRVIPFLSKKLGYSPNLYPMRDVEVSIRPKNFYDAAKKFIYEILSGIGADFSKNIVLDQPFVGNNPTKSFPFFENPKAIVVDRDPRDNYLFTKLFLSKQRPFIPIDNVQDFVEYYRLLRDNQPYQSHDKRVLRIQFENMIYNYDNTVKIINNFCNLPENNSKFTIFDPKISIPNTQLFRKYPKYENDIKYIEENLTEYLFNFQDYPHSDVGTMFSGRSPLNKR